MASELQGKTIAILAADAVEQVELERPRQAVQAAGAVTELLSIKPGQIQAVTPDIHPSVTVTVDRLVGEASAGDYDALILPGGAVNPDNLRQHGVCVNFVGKPRSSSGAGWSDSPRLVVRCAADGFRLAACLPARLAGSGGLAECRVTSRRRSPGSRRSGRIGSGRAALSLSLFTVRA